MEANIEQQSKFNLKKNWKIILGAIVLLTVGCLCGMTGVIAMNDKNSSSDAPTLTAKTDLIGILPTYTAYPTYTPQPLIVVTATFSPTPLFTATITPTPTITNTPTNSPTPSLTPTKTSTPNATKTQQAAVRATKGYAATATKSAQVAFALRAAAYTEIPAKELVTYSDNHKGEKVKVRGRVFNVNSDTEFQMFVGWSYDAVYVVMDNPFRDIYEDNWVTVYGVVQGENCGTNSFGGEICQPLIFGDFYEKK